MAIIMIALTACGGDDNSSSGKKGKSKKKGFKEAESFEVDYPVLHREFALDETGNVLFWSEDDNSTMRDQPTYVWVDGEKKDLGTDRFSSNAFLYPSGNIHSMERDHDKPEGEQISVIHYDPRTDTETEDMYQPDDEEHDVVTLHGGPGRYLEDSKMYVHTITNTDRDDDETFMWDGESDTIKDLKIIEKLKETYGDNELPNYPHLTLSDDASTIYAAISGAGIYAYDVEDESVETIVEEDELLIREEITRMLTPDEKYFLYGRNDSTEGELKISIHAVNVETKETVEIGEGSKIFALADGNVIIADDEEVKHFDFKKEKLDTIHTIELGENEDLNNLAVSTDGSTIAYGYTDKGGEDEDPVSYIKILKGK